MVDSLQPKHSPEVPSIPGARALLALPAVLCATAAVVAAIGAPATAPLRPAGWAFASVVGTLVVLQRWLAGPASPAAAPGPAAPDRGKIAWSVALGALALLLLYGPVLSLPFLNEEDLFHLTIVRIPARVGMAEGLRRAADYLAAHPATLAQSAIFPLWYLLDLVSGDAAAGYRSAGLLLHAATGLLAARLARRLGLSAGAAAGAGLMTLVAAVGRPVVRDPTGLPELAIGAVYLALLALWIPRLEGEASSRSGRVAAYGLLPLAALLKPVAVTLPFTVLATVVLRWSAIPAERRPPARAVARRALPLFTVAAFQLALLGLQFHIDPAAGREHGAHAEGEYGLAAEGGAPERLAAAAVIHLPRSLVWPAWDGEPAATRTAAMVCGLTAFALLGLGVGRCGLRPLLCGGVIAIGSAGPALLFLGPEGPANAHLLYTATAGAAIAAAAWVESLPPRRGRAAAALLACWVGATLVLHVGRIATERNAAARLSSAQRGFDALDRSLAPGTEIHLLGGTDEANRHWRHLVLSRHARGLGPRGAYVLDRDAVLLERSLEAPDPTATPDTAAPVVLGWVDGEVRRLGRPREAPTRLPRVPAGRGAVCSRDILIDVPQLGAVCPRDEPLPLHPIERLLAEM